MIGIIKTIITAIKSFDNKWKYLKLPVIFMLFSNITSIFVPLLVMKIMDQFKFSQNLNLSFVFLLMLGWLLSLIFINTLEYYRRILIKKYDNIILINLNYLILQYYNRGNYQLWIKSNSKESAEEVKKDLEDVISLLPGISIQFMRNFVLMIITSIILFVINWKLVVVTLFLIPLFILSYFLWTNKIKVLYKDYRHLGEIFLSGLVEYFQSVPLIKIYDTSEVETQLLNDKFKSYLQKQYAYYLIVNKRQTYNQLISSIAPIYLAFCLFFFIYLGIVTTGEVFAFWGIFSLFIGSLKGFTDSYEDLIKSTLVFEKINGFQDLGGKNFKTIHITTLNEIITKNLVVSFKEHREIIIAYPNLKLMKGEIIQISGKSGSGKTTFIKMLLDFYRPIEGNILINGHSICDVDKKSYYKLIGYVEQNGYIYSRSFKENILLGRAFNAIRWEKTINLARLNDLLDTLENRENEHLGENGIQISGGERQRILIARAIYHQPQWLFLDEPFIAIDTKNQIEITKILKKLSESITIVLISHQDIPFLNVDKRFSII